MKQKFIPETREPWNAEAIRWQNNVYQSYLINEFPVCHYIPGLTLTLHELEECSVDPHLKHIPVPCSISFFAVGHSDILWPGSLQL